ncbi:MAG: patatin-like phospholipase family protein [Candidatus Saganbacteria bacterium]|nr:patatin-like phospholipase family protein [Candidatus Saganbacteria bacterium]
MLWPILGKKKIGLVLGGGIARGIAHIGVLKVIERYKIPIEYISATSSGALIGSAYAAGMEVRLIEEIGLRISWGRIIRLALFKPGLISDQGVKDLVRKYIGELEFSQLKIPLSVVATDLKSARPIIFSKGDLAKAVAASSAFPGLFSPEEINHHLVVDGAITYNLPVQTVRDMGANFVIASDVIPSGSYKHQPHDPLQVFSRALDIVLHQLSYEQRKKANILIDPDYKDDIWPFDLSRAKALIAAGEHAAHNALRRLRRQYK